MQRLSSLWRRLPLVQSRQARFNRNLVFRLDSSLSRWTHTAPVRASLSPSLSTMGQPTESFGNYDLIKRVKLDFTDVVVSKWKSRVTGLTVIHMDYEGMFSNLHVRVFF